MQQGTGDSGGGHLLQMVDMNSGGRVFFLLFRPAQVTGGRGRSIDPADVYSSCSSAQHRGARRGWGIRERADLSIWRSGLDGSRVEGGADLDLDFKVKFNESPGHLLKHVFLPLHSGSVGGKRGASRYQVCTVEVCMWGRDSLRKRFTSLDPMYRLLIRVAVFHHVI